MWGFWLLIWNSGLPTSRCLVLFPKLGKFSASIFLNKLSLSFFCNPYDVNVGQLDVVQKSLKLSLLFYILFAPNWMNSTALCFYALILSSIILYLIYCSTPLLNFHFSYFSPLWLLFMFLSFLFLCWNSHFVPEAFFWPQEHFYHHCLEL